MKRCDFPFLIRTSKTVIGDTMQGWIINFSPFGGLMVNSLSELSLKKWFSCQLTTPPLMFLLNYKKKNYSTNQTYSSSTRLSVILSYVNTELDGYFGLGLHDLFDTTLLSKRSKFP